MKKLAALLSILAMLWAAGFILYLNDAEYRANLAPTLDDAQPLAAGVQQAAAQTAIVVLTGGSERIATGLKLLHKGYGAKLFISGAGQGADYAEIFSGLPRSADLEACCIALGHQADDTVGNANETIAWLRQERFTAILLVTAHYHMLRSLLEFAMLDPALTVNFHAVKPARVPLTDWWQRPGTTRLLVVEYNKLLITLLRYGWLKLQ